MLRQGLYVAENDENIWNAYRIEMRVKETEKSYILNSSISRVGTAHLRWKTFLESQKINPEEKQGWPCHESVGRGQFHLLSLSGGYTILFQIRRGDSMTFLEIQFL